MALTAEKDLEKAIEKLLRDRRKKEFKPTKTGSLLRFAGSALNAPAYTWMGDKIDQYVRKKQKEKEEKEAAEKAAQEQKDKESEQTEAGEKKSPSESPSEKLQVTILKLIQSMQGDISFIKERLSPKFFDAKSGKTGELKKVMYDPLGPSGGQFRRATETGTLTSAMPKDLEKSALAKVASYTLKKYREENKKELDEKFEQIEDTQAKIAAAAGVNLDDPTTFVDPTAKEKDVDVISKLREEMNDNFKKIFKKLDELSTKSGENNEGLLDTLGDVGGALAGLAMLRTLMGGIGGKVAAILTSVVGISKFLGVGGLVAGVAAATYGLYRMVSGKQVADSVEEHDRVLSEYGIKTVRQGRMGTLTAVQFGETGKVVPVSELPPKLQTLVNAATPNSGGVFRKEQQEIENNPEKYDPNVIRQEFQYLYEPRARTGDLSEGAPSTRPVDGGPPPPPDVSTMTPAQQIKYQKEKEYWQREYDEGRLTVDHPNYVSLIRNYRLKTKYGQPAETAPPPPAPEPTPTTTTETVVPAPVTAAVGAPAPEAAPAMLPGIEVTARPRQERLGGKAVGAAPRSRGGFRRRSPKPSTTPNVPEIPIDFSSYRDRIAMLESSNDYTEVNSLGYLGKYQFGSLALQDMGLVKPKTSLKGLDDPANWTIEGGKQAFLDDPNLQEQTFIRYTTMNYKTLQRIGVLNEKSTPDQIAGYLAAAHLVGPGGAKELMKGEEKADAYGTKASKYYKAGVATQTDTSSLVASTNTPATPSSGTVVSTSSPNLPASAVTPAMAPAATGTVAATPNIPGGTLTSESTEYARASSPAQVASITTPIINNNTVMAAPQQQQQSSGGIASSRPTDTSFGRSRTRDSNLPWELPA